MENIGNVDFEDCVIPALSKSDWGMDIMVRKMKGSINGLDDFLKTLSQGQQYTGLVGDNLHDVSFLPTGGFFLQMWTNDDHNQFPTVTLVYKGLINGALPTPVDIPSFTYQRAACSTEASLTTPSGTIINAVRNVSFTSPSTTWRYIMTSKPQNPQGYGVSVNRTFRIVQDKTVATYQNGQSTFSKTFIGNFPAGLALNLSQQQLCQGWTANPVFGSPYYECEETWMVSLIGVTSD